MTKPTYTHTHILQSKLNQPQYKISITILTSLHFGCKKGKFELGCINVLNEALRNFLSSPNNLSKISLRNATFCLHDGWKENLVGKPEFKGPNGRSN